MNNFFIENVNKLIKLNGVLKGMVPWLEEQWLDEKLITSIKLGNIGDDFQLKIEEQNLDEKLKKIIKLYKVANETELVIKEYLEEVFIKQEYEYSLISAGWPRNCLGCDDGMVYMPFMPIPNGYRIESKSDICRRKYANVVNYDFTLLSQDGIKFDFEVEGQCVNPYFEEKHQSLKLRIKSKFIIINKLVIKIKINDELEVVLIKDIEESFIKNLIKDDINSNLIMPDFNKKSGELYYNNKTLKQFLQDECFTKFNKLKCYEGEHKIKDHLFIIKVLKDDLLKARCEWQEQEKIKYSVEALLKKYTITILLKDIEKNIVFESDYYEVTDNYDLDEIVDTVLKN